MISLELSCDYFVAATRWPSLKKISRFIDNRGSVGGLSEEEAWAGGGRRRGVGGCLWGGGGPNIFFGGRNSH